MYEKHFVGKIPIPETKNVSGFSELQKCKVLTKALLQLKICRSLNRIVLITLILYIISTKTHTRYLYEVQEYLLNCKIILKICPIKSQSVI